jgi:adenosine deaminase
VTVSTDGRTVSDTSVTAEFERLQQHFGWGASEFWRCQRNAAQAAFVSHDVKRELLERIRSAESAASEAARA